ncbi:DUF2924 domain-containing protein [Novosphingobium aquae]|uniref:DUF2924 domain-containing protein n=1 Tax=Novosphingobium aquae TaxID=3133435 RepID=A0ABU8S7D6_9SPHN
MTRRRVQLEQQLAKLERMSAAELRSEWDQLTGRPAPKLSPKLLRLAVGYELQAHERGGLSRRSGQDLAKLAAATPDGRSINAGMRLVREWAGKIHVVTIGEDRVIRWNDREWGSLSEVARAITGTRWSGPLFFGLKTKEKAA